jgi:hypothetical protein
MDEAAVPVNAEPDYDSCSSVRPFESIPHVLSRRYQRAAHYGAILRAERAAGVRRHRENT